MSRPAEFDPIFEAATTARDAGEHARALALFQRCLEVLSEEGRYRCAVYTQMAFVHRTQAEESAGEVARDHLGRAVDYGSRAVEAGPRSELASLGLFFSLLHLERWEDAFREAARYLTLRDSPDRNHGAATNADHPDPRSARGTRVRQHEARTRGTAMTGRLPWLPIPAGTFQQGLTDAERLALDVLARRSGITATDLRDAAEMLPPARQVSVAAFEIMARPITVGEARAAGADPSSADDHADDVAYLEKNDADAVATYFDALLPTESQWEFACRGGTQTLFWWGNTLLDGARLETIIGSGAPAERNGFGLYRLFDGEWCSTTWDSRSRSAWVVKGGAGRVWPWQAPHEWISAVSAYRLSSRLLADHGAAVRLVRPARSQRAPST
jgi:formylglycine-generating enzyme required for sulfatase activity